MSQSSISTSISTNIHGCGDPSSSSLSDRTVTGTSTSSTSCCDCKTRQASLRRDDDSPRSSSNWNSEEDDNDDAIDNDNDNCGDDPWTYSGRRLQALEFPLGGFGTGQINVQGDGTLQGWTIANNFHGDEYTPLYYLPGNLFAIQATKATATTAVPQSYVLRTSSLSSRKSSQPVKEDTKLLPGIPSLTAKCQYPIATLYYTMPTDFPVHVQLECMTPLNPGSNDHAMKDSSIPVAIFTFTVQNSSDTDSVHVSLLQSTLNFLGWDGKSSVDDDDDTDVGQFWESNVNTPIYYPSCSGSVGYAGWSMTSQNPSLEASRQGSLALVAVTPTTTTTTSCGNNKNNNDDWKAGLLVSDHKSQLDLWEQFCQGKMVNPATYTTPTDPSLPGHTYIGGVTQTILLPPQSTRTCQFLLTWYFPNRPSYSDRPNLPSPILGNYYQNWYTSAQDVVKDVVPRLDSLVGITRKYVQILYSTTIPWELLESAAGRVSVLRSPSMFWTQQGIVLGNEGNQCCPLNCTHVYGYSMLMERLYPGWAKNMLYSNFVLNFDDQRGCSMRFGNGGFAIDGSLASVIKVYLVVRQADSKLEFLTQVWPNVKRQIQIILEQFIIDSSGSDDCVIRCLQQNTYDTAMQGANTFIGSYWVTALRVTAIMAELMGDKDFATSCQQNSEKAAKAYERICWNEEFQYYIADVDETNCAHSYGTGCFIDQLCAVGLSLASGLGTIFDPDHEAAARRSIFQQNQVVKPPFQDFQKHFFDGDEGVRVNTYPHGQLPGCYVYDDLVSTGFEYPVIAAMIQDGNTEMAVAWARKIRRRHSGVKRSPWNEPECGLLYVRAMDAWGLYDRACGFQYDSTTGALSYDPKFHEGCGNRFSCFLIVEDGWGQYRQEEWGGEQPGQQKGSSGQIVVQCTQGCIRFKSLSFTTTAAATATSVANMCMSRPSLVASARLGEQVVLVDLRVSPTAEKNNVTTVQLTATFSPDGVSIPAGSQLVMEYRRQRINEDNVTKSSLPFSPPSNESRTKNLALAMGITGMAVLLIGSWWFPKK